MRRQVPVSQRIYSHLFPRPSSHDPPNFSAYLARFLIPEIRIETARFYGSLETTEARYPGLNYTYPPHVARLSSFPHHARLFSAIAELGITDTEVLDMVRWEGTLWARERFEKDEGLQVKDTTGDGITDWVDPRVVPRKTVPRKMKTSRGKIRAVTTMTVTRTLPVVPRVAVEEREVVAEGNVADMPLDLCDECDVDNEDVDEDDDMGADTPDEDDETLGSVGEHIESIGINLNRRLLEAVVRRERGENVEMDPDFEAYLKEQIENGNLRRFIMGFSAGSGTGARPELPSLINMMSVAAIESGTREQITQPAA